MYIRINCHKFDLGVLRHQGAEIVFIFQMILRSHFQTVALVLLVKHGVRVITELYLYPTLYFPTNVHNVKKRRVIKTFYNK